MMYSILAAIDPGDFDVPKTVTDGAIETALRYLFILLGSISVLMVVIGGIRYIISTGNPERTSAAKNTIIYALVGIVISISAFIIVEFIFGVVEGSI